MVLNVVITAVMSWIRASRITAQDACHGLAPKHFAFSLMSGETLAMAEIANSCTYR